MGYFSGQLAEFPPAIGKADHLFMMGTKRRFGRFSSKAISERNFQMFGKLIGAMIGSRVAGQGSGAKGALIGAGVAAIARRGLGPLGLALGAGWAAKKIYRARQARRLPEFPGDVTPGVTPSL
jgi:hypothetical protein